MEVVRPTVGIDEVAVAVGLPEDVVQGTIGRVVELERVSGDERHAARERHLSTAGDCLDRRRTVDSPTRDDHPDPQAGDAVERHGRARYGRHRLRLVRGGSLCRGVHHAGGAEVEAELDVRLPGPGTEIDAGLSPTAGGVEQLLHRLVRSRTGCRGGRERVGKLGVDLVEVGTELVVGRHDLPRQTVVRGDEDPRAVAHRAAVGIALRVLRVQEIVEVQRGLVGVGVAGQAEGIRDEASIRSTGKIVISTDVGVRRQFLLPVEGARSGHPVLGVDVWVEVVVRVGNGGVLLEPEVHADAAILHVTAGPGVVRGGIDPVAGVAAAGLRRMPEIDVQRRECQAGGTGDDDVRDLGFGHAVGVVVEDVLHQRRGRPGRVELDADELAGGRDGEEIAGIATVLEVLRRGRESLESPDVGGEIGKQRGAAPLAHPIELASVTDAVERRAVVAELETGGEAGDPGPLDLPLATVRGVVGLGGVAVGTSPVQIRLPAVADRREDVEVVLVAGALDRHRVDGVAEALPPVSVCRRHRRVGDRVTDRRDVAAGDGVDLADMGHVAVVTRSRGEEEPAVGPHVDIADGRAGIPSLNDRGHGAAGEGVAGEERIARRHEEGNVSE